jgi:hypothetical protein
MRSTSLPRAVGPVLALAGALVLAACVSEPPPPPPPTAHVDFSADPKIRAPAGIVAFDDAYVPPLKAPNVEQDHEVRPSSIVRTWVRQRMAADFAMPGKIKITVIDGSVTSVPLKMESGISTLFKRQAEYKMTGTLKWRISYKGGHFAWSANGHAESQRQVLEEPGPNGLDDAYVKIVDELAKSFNSEAEKQIEKLRAAVAEADKAGTN